MQFSSPYNHWSTCKGSVSLAEDNKFSNIGIPKNKALVFKKAKQSIYRTD